MKKWLFNSVTISLPKNTVQFSLGVVLYWIIFGMPDIYATALALTGFLTAYSSVYLYNDMVDHKEDKKDTEKLKWKPIASGHLNIHHSRYLTIIFAFTGLLLSFLAGRWFFILVLLMLILNILHSSPLTRFKKSLRKTALNMTAIEFLKFSCGWFALTSDLTKFPFWLILAFSIVYTASYLIYKFKFSGGIIKSNKKLFIAIGAAGSFSYTISFIQYGFPLSMILLVTIPLFVLLLFKQMDIKFHRINNMIIIEYLLLPVVIISFMILSIPIIAQANENIISTIDKYEENLMEEIPDTITQPIENITSELNKYEKLEDIENEIKEGLDNITNISQIKNFSPF